MFYYFLRSDSKRTRGAYSSEEQSFWEHVKKIEMMIMAKFDVVCLTVAALADSRVESWNKQLKISTVLLDEGGSTIPGAYIASAALGATTWRSS